MKKILLLLLAVLGSLSVGAQGYRDIRINEILVKNVDSYADDHAHKVGWIELFNSGYSQVNIAGVHFRFIQGADTIVYRIPKTDIRTLMAPQGYLIFFADRSSNKGTFHTNFMLDVTDSVRWQSLVGKNDRLEILDQSGNELIDFIEYDVNTQMPDVSYGRIKDDEGNIVVKALASVTPMQGNETIEPMPKNEVFRRQDPAGITMSLTAMTVVFMALICLYLVFKYIGKFNQRSTNRKEQVAQNENPTVPLKVESEMEGETIAAIAMALRLYEDDMHDIESTVLTINRVARAYSPWSSKIYSLRQLPNKK